MLVKLLVALVFGCGVPNLDIVGMLIPRIGGGSGVGFRPFAVPPPSCRGGKFHRFNKLETTSSPVLYIALWAAVFSIFSFM